MSLYFSGVLESCSFYDTHVYLRTKCRPKGWPEEKKKTRKKENRMLDDPPRISSAITYDVASVSEWKSSGSHERDYIPMN